MARQYPRTVPIAASTGPPSPWSQPMPGAVTRTACAVTRTAWAVTRTAWAVTRFTSVTRHVIFDRVFDLLAGVFEVGLRLVGLALVFNALVAGDLADRFLGLYRQATWILFFALSAPLTVSAPTSRGVGLW